MCAHNELLVDNISGDDHSDHLPEGDTPSQDDEPELTLLLDKYIVETDFLDTVEEHFQDIYPHLLEDTEYAPEDLCGEAFWAGLSEHGQRMATLCPRHLAALDDRPLVEERCSECGAIHFRIV